MGQANCGMMILACWFGMGLVTCDLSYMPFSLKLDWGIVELDAAEQYCRAFRAKIV